jgi:hypothetical protein
MDLRRWTPLTFVAPARYVDSDDWWGSFDLEAWSQSAYVWTEDAWNGYRDVATYPRECVELGRGDCEDYALVALAWAVAHDRDGIGLGFCWDPPYPWPRHVIAYDEERVYSSGDITETSVEDWLADSSYAFVLKRRVSGPS